MSNCSWSSFLPDIIPFVSSPKADYRRPPDNLIMHFARLAAQEFVQDAALLRDTYCFDIQCGVDEIPLVVPDGREIMHVHTLHVSSDAISMCGNHCLVHDDSCRGCGESKMVGVRGFEYDDGELKLPFKPTGDKQNGFCARYSYTLDFSTCQMPKLLCEQKWRRAIRAYTLKHLFSMDDMDWGDKAYYAKYETEAAKWAAKGRMFAANHGVTKRKRISPRMGDLFWS